MTRFKRKRGRPYTSAMSWLRGLLEWWSRHRSEFIHDGQNRTAERGIGEPALLLTKFQFWIGELPLTSPASWLREVSASYKPGPDGTFLRRSVLARAFRIAMCLVVTQSHESFALNLVHLMHNTSKTLQLEAMYYQWRRMMRPQAQSIGDVLLVPNPVLQLEATRQLIHIHEFLACNTGWKPSKGNYRPPWSDAIARHELATDSPSWVDMATLLAASAVPMKPGPPGWMDRIKDKVSTLLLLPLAARENLRYPNEQQNLGDYAAGFVAFVLDTLAAQAYSSERAELDRRDVDAPPADAGPATLVIEVRRWPRAKPPKYVQVTVDGKKVKVTVAQAKVLQRLHDTPCAPIEVDHRTVTYMYKKRSGRQSLVNRIPHLDKHLIVNSIPGCANRRSIRGRSLLIRLIP